MNMKIPCLIGIAIAMTAASGVSGQEAASDAKQPAPRVSTPVVAVPSDVPTEYRDKYIKIMSWLDQKLIEWKPSEYKPMNFAAYHVFASDNMFVRSNEEIDLKVLDALEQTNSDIIVLYIRPKSYFSQKERYDTLINKIRTDGKKLFIGARFDEVRIDFMEYEKELTDYTKNIIATIKPDFYGVVIEPRTMERINSFKASDKEWVDLVKRISELSKQLSPDTKTAVAGHKEELKFLQLAAHINSVDIIGFDIYDNGGIYSEYSGYLGKGDVIGNTIDYANSKGKETWILETWVADITAGKNIKMVSTQEYMKPIDAKWIRVITYYALRHNMKVITPFFTGKFVVYTENPAEFKSALDSGQRTVVFHAYKSVIEEFRKGSK
ncbi:MAG: hypothetical protein KKG09_00485 [Verrucomicrobia bacterium]|nr:hypothetical protein [Verrucomicrobiota bacterium]MBU4430282.1 hypothetical protein [Verrucomicrobiota bacterium]MBU4496468.1 hypothetical protein [Verrucomicrobiota bacterium]MCG2679680.1 hypothetical protein [Kiritimatiellia bacterium]